MPQTTRIREFNDHARTTLTDCRLVITSGVQALGNIENIFSAVQTFDEFNVHNDPYAEHDFGSFEMSGQSIFWKFDYYDLELTSASPNPADPTVTQRVLTIMLAREY